ncbi:FHA domain-containing protein [Rathayibacter oskolensis]|uniref:FHA domain-containing protein n=1 Tax=Rathayibacter oskolensis TaxID=1891671 RepID=UPI002660075A|nr:FHA domain-containing protein [Rathayibacter oskolensis]WKK70871.1 FHA domain-containing protein [Rathayibacter oskolensis]
MQPPSGAIARLELSTGDIVELDRPVVIGRRPSAGRAAAHELPHLVTVPSPLQDISRSHVEVRAEGRFVVVRDLASVNGTVLLRSGQAPVRLTGSESMVLAGGDVLDLGDGVTVTVRERA